MVPPKCWRRILRQVVFNEGVIQHKLPHTPGLRCGTIRMHGMNFHCNNKTRWLNKTLTTITVYIFSQHETNDLDRSTMTCISHPVMKTYHTMNNEFAPTQLCGSRLSGGPHSMKEKISIVQR